MVTDKPVLNLKEAAEFLGFSVPKVRAMAESGEIPGRSFGPKSKRSWRFSRAALEEILRQPTNKVAA